jgi:hypothetical protein
MSYGVFRPAPDYGYPAPRRHTAGIGTLARVANTFALVSFPTPQSSPSGDEEFAVEVRRTATGANDPQVRIELWENGTFRATALADTPVTSTTSQIVRGTWNASSLSTADGSDVQCYVYGTSASHGAQVEIGAVEWNATPAGGGPQTIDLGLLSAAVAQPAETAVSPGPVRQTLALQSTTSALQNATVTPGAVSQTLALQSAAGALLTATASTTGGPQTVNLGLLSATAAMPAGTAVSPGPVSQNLALQSAASALQNATVTPGAVSQNLALQSAVSAIRNLTVTPGAVSQNLALQQAVSALRNATVTPGAVSTPLALQSAAAALLNANVSVGSGPQTINLGLLSAAGALRNTTALAGTFGRFSFPTPLSAPSGQEEFTVQVRRTATGAVNPRVRIELRENGTFRQHALTSTAVTSQTSQIVRGVWDSSSLVTTNGSQVEAYVYGIPGEDGAQVEIGAVEWNATPYGGPQTIELDLLSGTSALRNTTVIPGPVTLQLLISPATAGEAETIAQLANRTIDELMSDSTTAGSSLRNLSQTVTLGLLSAAAVLRNATASTSGTTVNLALQTASAALRNITVTGGATTTQLARLEAVAALLTAIAEIPGTLRPKAVVSLEVVPTATAALEVVPKATVTLEVVPTATLSVETVPKAATDLEVVPRVLVGVEP